MESVSVLKTYIGTKVDKRNPYSPTDVQAANGPERALQDLL
jgi:hypothetical protein